MRSRPVLFAVFLCVSSIVSIAVFADENPPLIHVSAQGVAKALPDQAHFNLNFSASAPEADKAREIVDQQLQTFLKKLKNFELESQTLDTGNVSVYPQYEYYKQQRELKGYQVNRNVSFTLNQLSQLESLVKLITQTQTCMIENVSYQHSNASILRDEALEKAIRNATRLGKTIADGFGVSLAGIQTVSHHSNNFNDPRPMLTNVRSMEQSSLQKTYEQKEIEYSASIDVAFRFN